MMRVHEPSSLRWIIYIQYRHPSDCLRHDMAGTGMARGMRTSARASYMPGDNHKDGATYARAVIRNLNRHSLSTYPE